MLENITAQYERNMNIQLITNEVTATLKAEPQTSCFEDFNYDDREDLKAMTIVEEYNFILRRKELLI